MTSRRQEVDIQMWVASLVLVGVVTTSGWASTSQAVQDRLDRDIEAGSPVVVHVVVALCDNANQGIVPVPNNGTSQLKLRAGGSAHLVVYVGHNGLMDFSIEPSSDSPPDAPAKSAVVLACASKSYFLDHLRAAGAHPLLLTTGLMAPEAYTLDAAIRSWIREGTTAAVIQAAAEAYNHYQKCGIGAAQRLFWGAP